MKMDLSKIDFIFNDSMYLSRLYIDVNICIKHLNDIFNTIEFIENNFDQYKENLIKKNIEDTTIPFKNYGSSKEINKMLYCKVWDSFLLYLKNLLFVAASKDTGLSNRQIKKIDAFNYSKIKEELDTYRICPFDQVQWEHFNKLNDLRNKITHNHELGYMIKTLKTQSTKHLENNVSISNETLYQFSKNIINFSKKIDKEFLKNYSGIS